MDSVTVFSTAENLFQAAAQDFVERTSKAIEKRGMCNVVLSGGNTPKKFFDVLVNNIEINKKISWEKIRFFFGDERYVPSEDPQSNYHTAEQFLFSKVGIPPENIYRVPTELVSAAAVAEQYEKTLRELFHLQDYQWPDFDITYLGMGDNGHTASLMPFTDVVKSYCEPIHSPALVVGMWVEALKMFRITLTPPAINHSRYIAFLVEGEAKADALKEVVENKKDPLQYPAILIKNPVWFVDRAAANKLEKKYNEQ
jgi:6-phosphogluconolactonase